MEITFKPGKLKKKKKKGRIINISFWIVVAFGEKGERGYIYTHVVGFNFIYIFFLTKIKLKYGKVLNIKFGS